MVGEQPTEDLQVGDVALDTVQGQPVHVVEDTGLTAREWSELNDYDLPANYGNSRCGVEPTDHVYETVYCSDPTRPSKTYAMPASRLLRVETEAGDDGRPVADRVRRALLEDLFAEAHELGNGDLTAALNAIATEAADEDLVSEARELADVERTVVGGDD